MTNKKINFSNADLYENGNKLAINSDITAAINTLDVSSIGGSGQYIQSISETDGKIAASAVTLNKAAVGLDNVDNTSDLNKPISTAAQTALNTLDGKIDDLKVQLPPKATRVISRAILQTGSGSTKSTTYNFVVGHKYQFEIVSASAAVVIDTYMDSTKINSITGGCYGGSADNPVLIAYEPTQNANKVTIYSTAASSCYITEIEQVNSIDSLVRNELIIEMIESVNYYGYFHFALGHQYKITNTSSSSAGQFYTRITPKGSNIQTISDGLVAGSSVIFTPTTETFLVKYYLNGAGSFKVEMIDTLADSDKLTHFKPYQSGQINFTVPVNQRRLYNTVQDITDTTLDNESTVENVTCVCMLPTSYTPNGKPSKLMMICHGSGGGVSEGVWFRNEISGFLQNFLNDGYVIFDCNGYKNGTQGQEIWGCERGVYAYHLAYNYMIQNYNVDPQMYVYGFSMGGLTALNYCSRFNNVKALGLGSPVVGLYKTIWEDYSVQAKGDVANAYGFTNSTTYEIDKVANCDPYARMLGDENYYFDQLPVTKIWHGDSDTAVHYQHSQKLATSAKNAGKDVYYRLVTGRGHEICYGGDSNVVSEILMFFRRF